jgi:predicted phosphodiesterase
MLVTDSHGEGICHKTAKAILNRKRDLKPDIIIHMGDAWDYKSIRRGASPEEKAMSMLDDFDMGCDFLLFKGRQKNYFLWGNHDWRLYDVADGSDAPRSDAANMIIDKTNYLFRKFKVKTTPFDARNGVLRLGKLAFIHGYCHAQNAAKQHAETYGGTAKIVFAGDLHTDLYWRSISVDPVECYHVPCCTGLDPEYARRHRSKLRHCTGWGEIEVLPSNHFNVQIITEKGGKFYVKTKTEEY